MIEIETRKGEAKGIWIKKYKVQNLFLFLRLNRSQSSQSPEEAEQGSRTTLRPPCWEYTDLSMVFSGLVHILGIETRGLNFIWKVMQPCLECDDKLLGNRPIIVFLAIEHLLGIRSDVEVHYQLLNFVFFGCTMSSFCNIIWWIKVIQNNMPKNFFFDYLFIMVLENIKPDSESLCHEGLVLNIIRETLETLY